MLNAFGTFLGMSATKITYKNIKSEGEGSF